jgi:hypothetical protein
VNGLCDQNSIEWIVVMHGERRQSEHVRWIEQENFQAIDFGLIAKNLRKRTS